jgi:hypothetical protein
VSCAWVFDGTFFDSRAEIFNHTAKCFQCSEIKDIDMRFIGDQVLFVENNRSLADVARDMERQQVQGKPQSFELGAAPFNPFDNFRNVRPEEFMQ